MSSITNDFFAQLPSGVMAQLLQYYLPLGQTHSSALLGEGSQELEHFALASPSTAGFVRGLQDRRNHRFDAIRLQFSCVVALTPPIQSNVRLRKDSLRHVTVNMKHLSRVQETLLQCTNVSHMVLKGVRPDSNIRFLHEMPQLTHVALQSEGGELYDTLDDQVLPQLPLQLLSIDVSDLPLPCRPEHTPRLKQRAQHIGRLVQLRALKIIGRELSLYCPFGQKIYDGYRKLTALTTLHITGDIGVAFYEYLFSFPRLQQEYLSLRGSIHLPLGVWTSVKTKIVALFLAPTSLRWSLRRSIEEYRDVCQLIVPVGEFDSDSSVVDALVTEASLLSRVREIHIKHLNEPLEEPSQRYFTYTMQQQIKRAFPDKRIYVDDQEITLHHPAAHKNPF